MKSIIKNLSLFIVLALIFPIVANAAGGFSVSTRSINLAPNGTKTFSISANNAAGRVVISSSDSSIAAISSTSEFVDNNSVNIVVTGKRAGVATITVAATDMATYDMEEVKTSYSITVNVANPQTTTVPATKASTTTTKKSTVKITAKKKTTTARKKTTTTKPIATTPVVTESTTTTETTTVLVTEEPKEDQGNDRKGNIKLDEFRVVGYELKKENDKYILNIDSGINEIYVLASSKDETVNISGAGVVDIKAKNRIVVEVNKDGISDKYIIKIQKKKDNSIIIIAVLIIIIVGMLIYFIIDWKKNKSY